MARRDTETGLSAKISSIINAAPDYGEEEDDFTKVNQIITEDHSDSGDELNLAQFRKINIELLDAGDNKYAGVRSTRKNLTKERAFGSDTSDESDDAVDTGSVNSEPCSDGDADTSGTFEDDQENEDSSSESSDDENESSDEDDDAKNSMSDDSDEAESASTSYANDNSEKDSVNLINAMFFSDVEKGGAIRNQISIWDSLLECRIKFQKCLSMANKLPKSSKMKDFLQAGGNGFSMTQKQCQKSMKNVLNKFLELQKCCLDINTKYYPGGSSKRVLSEDEITSESDTNEEVGYYSERKRRKLSDFSDEIGNRHEAFIPFRNDTIQKWNDKTKVAHAGSKDFSAFEQSTLKQIETVLADKNRLLKRTRTKRSNYRILGEDDEEPNAKISKVDECGEIFDDDDFYHQLLRELLERKTSDVTDPVQLSRQWIQLQKERNKMKKTVDTKASKGRKIRYDVHQKLVNFMMPIDNITWTDEARSELLVSLFGKKAV